MREAANKQGAEEACGKQRAVSGMGLRDTDEMVETKPKPRIPQA